MRPSIAQNIIYDDSVWNAKAVWWYEIKTLDASVLFCVALNPLSFAQMSLYTDNWYALYYALMALCYASTSLYHERSSFYSASFILFIYLYNIFRGLHF